MPRNVVNASAIYGVVILLILSIIWAQIIFKKNAIQQHVRNVNSLALTTLYEKCKWVFLTGDLEFIMQMLTHISYKEHITCLTAYINDAEISDTQLKTAVLFKTALLYKKDSKKIRILNLLPQNIKENELLLKIAAVYCPDIIPVLYAWIKTHSEDYVKKQISAVYHYAVSQNNPFLFNCLLEYDIPLQPHQASLYLHIVLNEQKHHAFICLLMKAGAKVSSQWMIEKTVNKNLFAFYDYTILNKKLFPKIEIDHFLLTL